ncbi:MAG: prepilin-type N-terminal cleavage/methylation domain-containing protein [Pseudobdellovibrionaceae bacterium]|nr:prepilin-type N-terminal cleavage/methylation domain-containing protein [Pseudobdellovibrionaceae bacterium]
MNGDHENGFSLVSVLVALALLSLIALTANQAFLNSRKARSTLSAKLNFEEVDQAVLKILKNMAKASPASCYTASYLANQLSAYSFINMSHQLSADLSEAQRAALQSPQHAFANEAVERCKLPRYISDTTSRSDGTLYFCFRFNRDSQHKSSSISGSPHAFAEVKVQLVDAHNGNPISCDDFRTLKHGSMQVFYTAYWSKGTSSALQYTRRNSFFHVTK